jgi:hypothetical protein
MKVVAEFEESLKKFPPIVPGTPDPYRPPTSARAPNGQPEPTPRPKSAQPKKRPARPAAHATRTPRSLIAIVHHDAARGPAASARSAVILPPGYKDTVPNGYIHLLSDTYEGYALLGALHRVREW